MRVRCTWRSLNSRWFAAQTPLRVLFCGTDKFSEPHLRALVQAQRDGKVVRSVEVLCQQPASKKHEQSVWRLAKEEKLPLHGLSPKTPFQLPHQAFPDFDIAVVASFGHKLGDEFIQQFSLGVINAHGSLLPSLRGAAPVQRAILAGAKRTGVTYMDILPSSGIDTGDVLKLVPVEIQPTEKSSNLRDRMARCSADALIDVLSDIENLRNKALQQSDVGPNEVEFAEQLSLPKHARRIVRSDGFLDFANETAAQCFNRFRAVCEWTPVACSLHGKKVVVHDMSLWSNTALDQAEVDSDFAGESFAPLDDAPAGTCRLHRKRRALVVKCADGKCVALTQLVLPSRQPQRAAAFWGGEIKGPGVSPVFSRLTEE
ncbi:MAG: hypothetical protein MHM6MM_003593 [Cercozoa sp. M6MM]